MTHRSTPLLEAPAGRLTCRRSLVPGLTQPQLRAWAEGERARGRFVATWSDPADGLHFALSGVATEIEAASWHALEVSCSRLVEQPVREAPEPEPCVLVGGRFDAARPAAEP